MREEDKRKVRIVFHTTGAEAVRIRKTAKEAGLKTSPFIRLCLATEIARKTADPEAIQALADLFRKGVEEWVTTRVDHEVAKRSQKAKK